MDDRGRSTRAREVNSWVVCEDSGVQAIDGICPTHRGDACLIVVAWVDNSHVRRDLARLERLEIAARRYMHGWQRGDPLETGLALGDLAAAVREIEAP